MFQVQSVFLRAGFEPLVHSPGVLQGRGKPFVHHGVQQWIHSLATTHECCYDGFAAPLQERRWIQARTSSIPSTNRESKSKAMKENTYTTLVPMHAGGCKQEHIYKNKSRRQIRKMQKLTRLLPKSLQMRTIFFLL